MNRLRRHAFTMVELVIVLVIMGVMAFAAYKVLMASADKSKTSTLMKSEFAEIRKNAITIFEMSYRHAFDKISTQNFHNLFPKSYNMVSDTNANNCIFVSNVVTGCVWTIKDNTTNNMVSESTYSVNLDCSAVADLAMRKLIESKALGWVTKEYDIYGTLPEPDGDGNITFTGLVR
jgi:prepilin-type N-terminal cleavage/methylation domain-containing protein